MSRSARGQNLVLLALTMLFIVVMVTITLSLGVKVRQRHELQNLADVAAYSNAVQAARVFNDTAMVNRLMVSTFVAQAADQSLISYASYGRAMANAAVVAASNAGAGCDPKSSPGAPGRLANFAAGARNYKNAAFTAKESLWEAQDKAAGQESIGLQGTLASLASEVAPDVNPAIIRTTELRYLLLRALSNQTLTHAIVDRANQPDIRVLPTPASHVAEISKREFSACGELGAGLCFGGQWNLNMLDAAMGSRGNPFSTNRTTSPAAGPLVSAAANAGVSLSFAKENGSGYWSSLAGPFPHSADTTTAWADDHGTVTVSAGGCSATESIRAWVQSTDLANQDDQHGWSFKMNGDEPPPAEINHHTMGKCFGCPSVWVPTVGFQPVDDAADAFGQPKVMVALERDLSARRFPWELDFTFAFVPGAANQAWDGRGRRLESSVGRGLDVSKPTAVATAIVYFHRFDHWREVPNLLNPFWRATLVPADVDAEGAADLPAALAQPNQARAWTALKRAGFEGVH
jgi:hypothetical protein